MTARGCPSPMPRASPAAPSSSSVRRASRPGIAVLELPGVVHHVVGRPADEELERPRPGRLAVRVPGAERLEIRLPVRLEAGRGQDDVPGRADLDLPRELLR